MKKIITAILGATVIVLAVLCYIVVNNIDNSGPEINVVNPELVYQEGSDESVLIAAVTAIDEKGGDVSDTIKIEKILPSSDKTTVKVDYAAKDANNNITKKTVTYSYKPGAAPKPEAPAPTVSYNVVLVNNLGIENLANSYANILKNKGHRIVNIGMSTDAPVPTTMIYVTQEGRGKELLDIFPSATIVVGNIANRINVNSNGADVFIVLGYQHSLIP